MPDPKPGESRDDFVSRCMGDAEANRDFPRQDQRFAFCNAKYESKTKKDCMAEKAIEFEFDDDGAEAFGRLTLTLKALAAEFAEHDCPVIAREIADLAEDIHVVPALKGDPCYKTVVADLALVGEQIADNEIKARLLGLSKKLGGFAVPQTETDKADLSTGTLQSDGGALQAAQAAIIEDENEERFFVIDLKNLKIVDRTTSRKKAEESLAAMEVVGDSEYSGGVQATAKNDVTVHILKQEDEQRTVFGVVLEPEVVDAQDDIYSEEEITKTAWRFMERYQQFGLMHKEIISSVLVLESYVSPVDFEIEGQSVKKGTWLLRVRVLDDQIWEDVRSGNLTGFSIGGSAIRRVERVQS